jgi:hypothetical protein
MSGPLSISNTQLVSPTVERRGQPLSFSVLRDGVRAHDRNSSPNVSDEAAERIEDVTMCNLAYNSGSGECSATTLQRSGPPLAIVMACS